MRLIWDHLFWALVEVQEAIQVKMIIYFGQLKVKLLGGSIWGSRRLINKYHLILILF